MKKDKLFDPCRVAAGADAALWRHSGCTGVLFDVTSRMAEALGVLHYKCDKCGATFAATPPQPDSPNYVPPTKVKRPTKRTGGRTSHR